MAQGYPSSRLCFNKQKAKVNYKEKYIKITSRKRKKFFQEKSPDKTRPVAALALDLPSGTAKISPVSVKLICMG